MMEMLLDGNSYNDISRAYGISRHQVSLWLQPIIRALAMPAQVPPTVAKKNALNPRISAEQKAAMRDLLLTCDSFRQVADALGLHICTVEVQAKPMIKEMRASGKLRLCACGRPAFHQDRCSMLIGHKDRHRMVKRRIEVCGALIAGQSVDQISERFGGKPRAIEKFLRYLTPDQRKRRAEALPKATPVYARPFRDDLYARIYRAMPRWLTDAARDDAISDMYLAILTDEIQSDEIEADAKRFASRASNAFESKFGPRSLDEPTFHDSERRLVDMIVDPDTLEPLEHRLSC
jgi:hypothetical protein